MRADRLRHAFVKVIPERLEPGTLYISLEHATMLHMCVCGCGSEVVTPLSPTDWRMTFAGETVSVRPSVGSWSLPCRSHYVIEDRRIRWAEDWTDEKIEWGRARDHQRKAAWYRQHGVVATTKPNDHALRLPPQSAMSRQQEPARGRNPLARLMQWFRW